MRSSNYENFTRKTDTQTTYCHGWMDGLSGCFEKIAEMLFQKRHARKTDVKCDIRGRDGDFLRPLVESYENKNVNVFNVHG
jgi:hypothetical protein